MPQPDTKAAAMQILGRMIDRGQLVEGGWEAYCAWNPPEICECEPCHDAFEAGATHVFAALIMLLNPGKWEQDADRARLATLTAEIQGITQRFYLKRGDVAGSA